MTVAVPTLIVKAWATLGDHATIPINPPLMPVPGQATYDLGFPPATRVPANMGGVPPFGVDMNGVLFDVTGNIAWLQGGMGYSWDQDFSDENSGYALGAVIKSASNPTTWYYNRTAGNTNDPDVSTAGWTSFSLIASPTAVQNLVLAAGATNDLVIADGVGLVNLDTTAGAASVTGVVPQFDGQILIARNSGANLLTLPKDDTGSLAANRWRLAADMALIAGQSKCFKNFAGLPGWVAL